MSVRSVRRTLLNLLFLSSVGLAAPLPLGRTSPEASTQRLSGLTVLIDDHSPSTRSRAG